MWSVLNIYVFVGYESVYTVHFELTLQFRCYLYSNIFTVHGFKTRDIVAGKGDLMVY